MECVNKAGQLMSLAALQQHDPYIVKLLDVTGQVALYTFNPKANEWEKNEIEGTLFVYARSASPHHGFTIMNRLSTENLVEPINKDLEFQLQDPFLLYRNGNLGIYSIWFYDKADCQRIAQLMLQIVKQEALRAQRVSPDRGVSSRTNGCVQNRPTGILELLSKAKEEYQRSQSAERDVQLSCEALPSQEKREDVSTAQHEKSSHSVVKQITVEELFGGSLPQSTNSAVGEGLRGLSFGPPAHSVEPLLTPRLSSDPGGPALVNLFQACGSRDPRTAASSTDDSSGAGSSTQVVRRGSTGPFPPAYINPLPDAHGMPVSLPGFMPSPLVTPQSFRESGCKTSSPFTGKTTASTLVNTSKEVNAFTQSPALVKPIPAGPVVQGEESSLLLSPSVFQHSITKSTEPGKSSASPTSPTDPPTALYNRTHLQDALIHLIKNDPQFLHTIHEAYVQSLSKGLNNIKL